MIKKSVLFICPLLIIVSTQQKECPDGQFLQDDKCHKCGPCYDMWKDKIVPDGNNFLDFRTLERDIQRIEDRLRNNAEKLVLLSRSKTELLSQLKHAQSTQNGLKNDIDNMVATTDKWAQMMYTDEDKLRILEDDIQKLRKETEFKPAADNSGYFRQMDKAKADTENAVAKQEQAINKIKDLGNLCNVLNEEDLNATLGERIKDEQDTLQPLLIQYQDAISTTNATIPCEDALCILKSKCRVCKDFEKCFDNGMLETAAEVLKNKFENLEKLADDTFTSIPLLQYELRRIKDQKKLVEAVLNTTNSSEININKRIQTFLGNFSFEDVDILKSILRLQPNKEHSYLKKLSENIQAIINDWKTNDMNDLFNKSEDILHRAEIMKDNIEFLIETFRAVKAILQGENVTSTEKDIPLKSFLLELSEILDEIDRRYIKVLNKKSTVEEKLTKLEQLSLVTDNILKEVLTASEKTKLESIEINANVNNELAKLIKKLDIVQEMERRNITLNIFLQRIDELFLRSEDLVNKIKNVPEFSTENLYVNYLETSIDKSSTEIDDILELVTNKSRVYDKCR